MDARNDAIDAWLKRFQEVTAITNERLDALVEALEDAEAELSRNNYDSNTQASELIRKALQQDEEWKNKPV